MFTCIYIYIDGEQRVAKEIIEAIDEEKKSITFKVIEGDLMEIYKRFKVILHVETSGNTDLVTWTIEYEKMNEDIEEPFTSLQLLVNTAKDIDSHYCRVKLKRRETASGISLKVLGFDLMGKRVNMEWILF